MNPTVCKNKIFRVYIYMCVCVNNMSMFSNSAFINYLQGNLIFKSTANMLT